jgi:hypothetical protein
MIKLLIPKFDNNIKFIGYITIEVNDIVGLEDYNRITKELPGTPCGYCSSIETIGVTKKPVPITRFYDSRQKGLKHLKGSYINVVE